MFTYFKKRKSDGGSTNSDIEEKHENEEENNSGVIEIDDSDTDSNYVDFQSFRRSQHFSQPSPSQSSTARKKLQSQWANLFMKDWIHEPLKRGDDALSEVVEEWGEHGNLKTITSLEEYQKNVTEADTMDAWFRNSPLWRRFILRFISVLVLFLIIHIIGFILSITYIQYNEDPFVCKTESCKKISEWLNSSVNYDVDPCDDFYQHVCGNYNKRSHVEDLSDEDEEKHFLYFKSLRSDRQRRLVYGEMLRNTSDSYIFHQVRLVLSSCLNYTARNEIGLSGFVQTLNDIGLNPENSSSVINDIAFEIWRYTGQIGLFELRLHTNSYDGMRKYMTDYRSFYHNHVTAKGLPAYTFAFQQIISVMNITKFSAEEMARSYEMILDGIYLATDAVQSKNEDVSLWPKSDAPFLCQNFLDKLDNKTGIIDNQTYFLEHIVPMDSGQENDFHYALFICNGGLNFILNEGNGSPPSVGGTTTTTTTTTTTSQPNIDAKLSYKSYWIMWMFYSFYGALNPDFKNILQSVGIFPVDESQRGSDCLRELESDLPHIIHERLMKTYHVTDDRVEHAEHLYYETKRTIEEWLLEDERSVSFGKDTLKLYRDTIKFAFTIQNYRFSVSELEMFGYGESSKKITETDFLKNILILRQVLSDNELKKWRMEKGYFLPLSYHNFKYIIKEMVSTQYQRRPKLFHITMMPAVLYSPLYSCKELLPLYYGGLRSFFLADIIYRWRHYVWHREEVETELKLEPFELTKCTVVKSSNMDRRSTITIKEYRASCIPYHIIFDILLEMFQFDRLFKVLSKKFFYRKLIGFEKYSEEQLIFMKMIRHQCATNARAVNVDEVLTGLSNSVAFQNAWKCPENTLMNLDQKCYHGSMKMANPPEDTKHIQIERMGEHRIAWKFENSSTHYTDVHS